MVSAALDVAVFTAVDNGTHPPHNHQELKTTKPAAMYQAQGRDLE